MKHVIVLAFTFPTLLFLGCPAESGNGGPDTATGDLGADPGADVVADVPADVPPDVPPDVPGDVPPDELVQLTILHTSDLHHRATGYGPQGAYTPMDTSDSDPVLGGYARLAALINQIRGEQEAAGVPVLVLDSGDFMMGTVYDMTAADPLALRFFQAAGYDAVTLGNHEFDWTPVGLGALIQAGLDATPPFEVPVLATNSVTDDTAAEDDAIEAFFLAGVLRHKLVLDLDNGLRVGLLGNLGTGADGDAATAAPVTFDHETASLQAMVDMVRNDDGAEIVVLLSHGGIDETGAGEDVTLAGAVTGLDVIGSGHEHTASSEAVDVGGTVVFEPGRYGERLARLDITFNKTQGRIEEYTYQLLDVDDSIEGDADMHAAVTAATEALDTVLMAALGTAVLDPVVELDFELVRGYLEETGIGNLMADAYRTAATAAVVGSDDPTPFTMGAIPTGVIRDEVQAAAGLVTFSDLFNILPLGLSLDPANQDLPGWPLVSIYATAAEIQQICLIPAQIATMVGNKYYVNISGVRCSYDAAGPAVGVVNVVHACGNTLPAAAGGDEDLHSTSCDTQLDLEDTTTLYRVVTDLYTLLLMDVMTDILAIAPKLADGTEIDLNDVPMMLAQRIDADATTDGYQEVKAWVALLQFVQALPDAGGDPALPDIPADVYGPGGTGFGRVVPQSL